MEAFGKSIESFEGEMKKRVKEGEEKKGGMSGEQKMRLEGKERNSSQERGVRIRNERMKKER